MTSESIAAIREAEKLVRSFEESQRSALALYKQNNLVVLTSKCDHIYPWGDRACSYRLGEDDKICQICYSYVQSN